MHKAAIRRIAASAFVLIFLCFCLGSCGKSRDEKSIEEGKALATKFCSNCHLLPDPALLDKATWQNGVLPAMAEQLGIEVLEGNIYLHSNQSALSSADWNKLIKYYTSLAPEILVDSVKNAPSSDWGVFQLKKPLSDTLMISSTMLVKMDSAQQKIYTSDLENPGLDYFEKLTNKQRLTPLPTSATDLYILPKNPSEMIITCMGGMQALDVTKGQIFTFNAKNKSKPQLISQEMRRPIQSQPIDFNKDGLQDYLICAFGHNFGGLFIMKQLPDQTFQKVAVREIPGATQSIIRDVNQDGWPDIITLFAHGDEGIWLFLNDQKGSFTTRNLLRFPSVYGSSSFQMVDVTGDGELDIIYTAGDNSDFSRILKPYHGLYIFEGSTDFRFEQKYFYPIHGCTKAMAADFDQDGDLDIAVIAFFADLQNKPEETFLYIEQKNKAPNRFPAFQAHTLPIHTQGRWICMDVNDYDGDGDADIVLGNFSKGFLNQENMKPTWNTHTPFVLLENKSSRSK